MPGKIIYTNEQLRGDLQEILRQMTASVFTPDVVVGIARGGLVPATMLSHYLGKPLMTINYSLRDNMVSHVSEVADMSRKLKDGQKVLLVDDICDSGDTLREVVDEITQQFPVGFNDPYKGWEERFKVAVLWNNTAQDIFDADYVGREIDRAEDERWVIFPYEEWWKA
jgi:hypoxanthine phosphoribosyltransferase